MTMKGFILAIMMALSGTALADTITLGSTGCGAGRYCGAVPNDASPAEVIDLAGAAGYPFFYVYFTHADGTQTIYKANQSSGALVNVSLESGYFANPLNPSASWTPTGSFIVLNGGWSSYTTCTHSGRGQHCTQHYTFTGGNIVR
jgi:hypothetical protein